MTTAHTTCSGCSHPYHGKAGCPMGGCGCSHRTGNGRPIDALMAESKRISAEHGFESVTAEVGPDKTFSEKIMLMVGELNEAHEEYRAGHGLREVYYNETNPTKPEGVPVELADAVIRIFEFCESNAIDLEQALLLKMAYNETRPFKHGKLF